ncbi:PAS domain-containing sensor histidine kinase [Rickettsiella endosymbiont of Dermanyssus gallinae]|uniref:PAS domain-containing sensor histidine kinase n=1 Tax=Rickettsiella endosymbiont of Dermanyssus gallinae TaxID=2856608 RepID=UPI001C5285DD|nr:PAS domain-containing sensor histidine kinase [Rickettsiella endosymbiont of Dermanyssus gallinae]
MTTDIYSVLHSLGPLEANITENLLSLLPGNVFVVDPEGYVLWGNQRMLDTLNLKDLKDYVGKHIGYWDKYSWECCQEIIKSKKELSGEETYQEKYFFTRRKPLLSSSGKLLAILGLALDITEKKRGEIAERAKQAFTMNMAHDMRTPFSGIVGLAQLQEMGSLKTPEDVRTYGKMISECGTQVLEILNAGLHALDENEIDIIKKDKINLYKFAIEMQELITPSIYMEKLNFELNVDKNIGEIVTDKIRLKQILTNLLSNAVKFTPEGKVTLSFEKTDKLKITVSDTGIGINEDDHARIFDKFVKIKPSYKSPVFTGTGMGLYLTKKYVEELNGKISLTSSLGNGSTFEIEIPLLH